MSPIVSLLGRAPSTSLREGTITIPDFHSRNIAAMTRGPSALHISRVGKSLPLQIFNPDLSMSRNHSAWIFGVISIAITASAFGYAWSGSSTSDWVRRLIWGDPQYTIFTINLLSHV